jgi:general secretion pathway protein E
VARERQGVDVLMADPQDAYTLDAVRLATQREVRPRWPAFGDRRPVERWYGQGRSAMGAIIETAEARAAATWTTSSTCATSRPRRR